MYDLPHLKPQRRKYMRYLSKIVMTLLCTLFINNVFASESQSQYGLKSKNVAAQGNELYVVLYNKTNDTFISTATYHYSKTVTLPIGPVGDRTSIITNTIVSPDYEVCLNVIRKGDIDPIIYGCFAPNPRIGRINVEISYGMQNKNNKPIVTITQK